MSHKKNRFKPPVDVTKDNRFIKSVADTILKRLNVEKAGNEPAIFSVPTGFNSMQATQNKRATSAAVDFATLRTLSIHHETTRAAINARKRQITQLRWDIVDEDDDSDPQGTTAQREKVKQMLLNVGGPGIRFRQLLDKLLEDLLVIDAAVFYKQRVRSGQLYRIIPIDGTTIKLRVDDIGMRPTPPEIAFEQWIQGKKTADLTANELGYESMNPRNDSPYGLSPLESLIISLDASMRALLYNLNYLSDNNVPQGFLQVPDGWNINQIKEYKEWLDTIIAGSKATAKIYPIPSGTTYQPTSKPNDFMFKEFFDYLDRRVCMLYDIQPQELGLNLQQYKESSEGQELIGTRKGIKPTANFLEEIFTDIVKTEFGFPQFKVKARGVQGQFSLADIQAYVPTGIISIDEARNDMGLSKLGINNMVITATTTIPLDPSLTENVVEQDAQEQESLDGKTEAEDNKSQPDKEKPVKKPSNQQKIDKLEKTGINEGFLSIEKTAKFSDFKKGIRKALKNQLEPFTNEAVIARMLGYKKDAVDPSMASKVEQEMPSVDIVFDNQAINTFLKWVAEQGGNNAYKQLNIAESFSITSADFTRMLGTRSHYLIDSVDDTTKDWIVDQISSGHAANKTNAEIAQNIVDQSDEFTLRRANLITNTETANALGEGQLDIYRSQGIEEKQWITSEDDRVCPICEGMDGEIEKMDDDFSEGVDHEPAHPDCRCYTIAVLDNPGQES